MKVILHIAYCKGQTLQQLQNASNCDGCWKNAKSWKAKTNSNSGNIRDNEERKRWRDEVQGGLNIIGIKPEGNGQKPSAMEECCIGGQSIKITLVLE